MRFRVLLILVISLAAAADGLTIDDLVALRDLGYTESQIREEVARTGTRIALTPAEEAKLKAAGIGDDLIALLKGRPASPEPLEITPDRVAAMVAEGRTAEEILDAIAASAKPPRMTPAQALDLARRRVPATVLAALKGTPLKAEDLRRLASPAPTENEWKKLVDLVGIVATELSPAESLELVRAGVPRSIVSRLRAGAAPATAPAPPEARAAPEARPVLYATTLGEPGLYEHAGRRFVLRFPPGWTVVRQIEDSEASYIVTPEDPRGDPDRIESGIQLFLLPMVEDSVVQGKDPASILSHLQPAVRQAEPGLRVAGEIAAGRLGELAAASLAYEGSLAGKQGEFRIEVTCAEHEGTVFLALATAPKARFAAMSPTFSKIIADSRFGRDYPARLERSMEAHQLVKRHKGAVVSVVARTEGEPGASTGSGFLISRDGYLLTNWHVVWNHEKGKPHTGFYVEWDEGMRRPKAPAELLGFRFRPSVFELQHGVDIALLKIEPVADEPFRVTALHEVEPGDRVVTLGFPSRALLEGVSITITTGVVTRFNRGPGGQIETIFTDAAITHGSSGGPCVDLVTGGVIGLNTFGQPVRLEEGARDLNDLINYFGVVPIDACLAAWPLVVDLGLPPDGSGLDFFDAYQLSRLYVGLDSLEDAERLAGRAATLDARSADALCQVGSCRLAQGMRVAKDVGEEAARKLVPDVVKAFTDALVLDPSHEESLVSLASLHLQLGEPDQAAAFADREIASHPESFEGHLLRARCDLDRQRFDDALRHAEEAKRLAADVVPEAHMLAGEILFVRGDAAKGREEYAAAARIHPANLDARLGVGRSYEIEKQVDAAVREYQAVLADFPRNPVVQTHIGSCLYGAGRRTEAIPFLDGALASYARLRMPAPEDLFVALGTALEEDKKPDVALFVYVQCLAVHGKGERADFVNFRAADLNGNAKRLGIASAHLRWARAVRESEELKKVLAQFQLRPLSLAEIRQMLELNYPVGVAAQLVALTPLDFAVTSDDDVVKLLREARLPVPVVKAIIESQKAHGAERPQAGGIVGIWLAQWNDGQGNAYANLLRFGADGSFGSEMYMNRQLAGRAQGAYRADASTIEGQTADGAGFRYAYRFDGGRLILDVPGAGPIAYDRQQEGQ